MNNKQVELTKKNKVLEDIIKELLGQVASLQMENVRLEGEIEQLEKKLANEKEAHKKTFELLNSYYGGMLHKTLTEIIDASVSEGKDEH